MIWVKRENIFLLYQNIIFLGQYWLYVKVYKLIEISNQKLRIVPFKRKMKKSFIRKTTKKSFTKNLINMFIIQSKTKTHEHKNLILYLNHFVLSQSTFENNWYNDLWSPWSCSVWWDSHYRQPQWPYKHLSYSGKMIIILWLNSMP